MDGLDIVKVAETFRIQEDGTTRKYKQVLWKIGTDGPFTYDVPENEFDADKVRGELEKRALDIQRLRGRK